MNGFSKLGWRET